MVNYLIICFSLLLFLASNLLIAQPANNNCGSATLISLSTSTCSSPPAYSTTGATQSMAGCTGTADDDVWFYYNTPAGAADYAFIYVDPASSGFDPVFQALSGACGGQTSQACLNSGAGGQSESTALSGIAASTSYYIRVYGAGSGSGTDGSFTVCVFNGAKPSNDECTGAVNLAEGTSCNNTAGTSAWATASTGIPVCVGTADDDVWYKFTTGAGVNYEHIRVVPDANMDVVVQVFQSACGTLVSLFCKNDVGAGGAEDFYATGLAPGTQYYIRVYHYGSYYGNTTSSGTFTICVQGGPKPSNDDCGGAVNLPANGSCININGSTNFATPSGTGTPCSGGSVDDDVWYKFTAVDLSHTITVTPSTGSMDPQIQVLSGTCPGGLLSHQCGDTKGAGQAETMVVNNLTIGNTYHVRISHNGAYYGSNGAFTVCNIGGVLEPGDEPCQAKPLPTVTPACIYGTYNIFAGQSCSGCTGCGIACGSDCGTYGDVWFSFVAPTNGKVDITCWAGSLDDPTVTLYSATSCSGTFTQLGCNDDSGPGYSSYLGYSGLTGGSTYYIRVTSASSSRTGNFRLCVSTPSNDECASPTFVCDFNSFRGTTSYSYTESAWETSLQGCSGGPFGTGPGCPTGTTTENPSWMQFEASANTAFFTVSISDCWSGNGIQMQVLSGTCGGGMVSKSSFLETTTSQTVQVDNLTPGNLYYIMVDGYLGDVCNFQINGASGIATSTLTSPSGGTIGVCSGNAVTIEINPVGTGSPTVNWSSTPVGYSATGNTINPVPSTSPGVSEGTVTYTATITGNCITPQTLSATVTVEPTPPVPVITATPSALCGVTSLTLSAAAANANYFEWFDESAGGSVLDNGINYTPSVANNQTGSEDWCAMAYNNTGNPACTSSARGCVTVPINSWGGNIKWEGDVSSAWNNTANWGGCTPSCAIGVIIPAGTPNMPSVGNYIASIKDFTMDPAASLTLSSSDSRLNVCGDFYHNGSLVIGGTPEIHFAGNSSQWYIKTSTGSGDLPDVFIENSSNSGVVVLDSTGYQDMDICSSCILTLTDGLFSTRNTRTVNLKNSAPSAISGGNSTSYITGRLKRSISAPGTYVFPLGNSSAFEKMEINFTSFTGANVTTWFENNSFSQGSLPISGAIDNAGLYEALVNVGGSGSGVGAPASKHGIWTVIPNAGTATYSMILYGTNFDNAGSGLQRSILKRKTFECAGDGWELNGAFSSSNLAGNQITVERTGMSDFSKFAIGRNQFPLPIELVFFDAFCKDIGNIVISWSTVSENNNDYFTIERSIDGIVFEKISIVDGVGNSSEIKSYSFIDNNFPGGTCYYRLKQTDFDGRFEYFSSVSVSCENENMFQIISILPNPTRDNLNIFFKSEITDDEVAVHITDVLGKTIFTHKILTQDGFNQFVIDMSKFSNGFYYVKISNRNKKYIEKIVKQN